MPEGQIAIIVALREEYKAVAAALQTSSLAQGARFVVFQSGMGPAAAARTVEGLLASANPPRLICSSGFCGGLKDGIEVGAAILPGRVAGADGKTAQEVVCAEAEAYAKKLAAAGLKFQRGTLLSTPAVIARPEEKRALAEKHQAVVVDMESFAIAGAIRGRAEFFVLRVVSDSVVDELPAEVGSFLDEQGNLRLGQILRFALRSPRNLKTLWQLKTRSALAAKALTAAWKAVLE